MSHSASNGFSLKTYISIDGKSEVLVKWKGFDVLESSWEPNAQLYEGIPIVLRRWILKHASDEVIQAMREDHEASLGHNLLGEVFRGFEMVPALPIGTRGASQETEDRRRKTEVA
ncbi:hypothetical protein H310_14568 [Aphanomyces invadans]|uniref:Chromo domain-containing protein n=1 Tax=Aphanomyces invadans TaxID=157072 RepID=A0A024T9J4_9STRA|nr:hypothetical protein H310_14568 [Aphanomyces invadans]ETV90674.1 hypothetical protein H310_14568 [Aphanomyces invadans]|eukprot:XP_008880671.1 hypothetical protein H310_14568 [Aphanomyces invadans]